MLSKAALIRFVGQIPGLSHVLRWYARQYAEGSTVRIGSGHAKGMQWRRHKRYPNGYWTGQYEWPVQQAIARELHRGDVFYDLGANAGFFSLVAHCKVGDEGSVVSFDPDPANCENALEQIEINNIENWTVVQKALSDQPGTLSFARSSEGSSTGHLGQANSNEDMFDVEVTTLDAVLESYPPPQLVKIDIEGAEVAALTAASKMLREVRPTLLVELHGKDRAEKVGEILREAGYSFFNLHGKPINDKIELPLHLIAKPS
jgi:FkbM family methyltransferase